MISRFILQSTIVISAALGTSSCAVYSTIFKGDAGLTTVDELVMRIETVEVEAEMSQASAREALQLLHVLVTPGFDGDAVAAYAEFVESIDDSKQQAKTLRTSVDRMNRAADPFFEQWATDLEGFSNAEIRRTSQERLETTRAEYQAVESAAEMAQAAYDVFNRDLADHALYLGHDFNPNSVAEIEGKLRGLTNQATDLDNRFNKTLITARNYVDATALPVPTRFEEVEVDEDEAEEN